MGILGGVENLQWLFTGTLLLMTAAIPLFGWISSSFPRRQFLPYVYLFFIAMLVLFYFLLDSQVAQVYVARAFFIWASVFNLFVVSVFWSFMADLYSNTQARRLFGFIAAGGTVGALTGPALVALLVQPFGEKNLLLVSAVFLLWAIVCIAKLSAWSATNVAKNAGTKDAGINDAGVKGETLARQQGYQREAQQETQQEELIGGGIWSGITMVIGSPYVFAC